jgi:signal transduction histidine kinase/CheY-like chemotaxis protein
MQEKTGNPAIGFTQKLPVISDANLRSPFPSPIAGYWLHAEGFPFTFDAWLADDEEVLGNVIILSAKEYLSCPELIESFIRQAAVFLKSRQQLRIPATEATEAPASKPLKDSAQKLNYFSYISHEIRSPLNIILGFTDVLSDELGKEHEDTLNMIRSSGQDILNLADDVLDLAKIEAGKARITKEDFNVIALLGELRETSLALLKRYNKARLDLRLDLSGYPENITVNSDVKRIKQVFRNLIGNAVKFTKEGFIEFGIHKIENGYIGFFVKDTGIGIPEEKREAIFNAFEQTENTKNQGTGLGLTISRKFIDLMGGRIWVESEIDKGSVFFFTVPFSPELNFIVPEKHAPEPKIAPAFPYIWKDKTILIVEDIESEVKLTEGLLGKTGAKLIVASDGKNSIEICRNNPEIDIVLMDIQLPVIDGYMAAREIKKFNTLLKIIAVTAYIIPDEKIDFAAFGFSDLIEKPFDSELLYKTIDKNLSTGNPG